MGCLYKYGNKEYTENEFKLFLSSGEFQRLVKDGDIKLPGLEQFYQLNPTQQSVIDVITSMNDSVKENDSTTYLVNDRPVRRVTSIIKARQKKKFGAAVDQATKDEWDKAAQTGTELHSYNQDIVNKITGKPSVVDITKLDPTQKKAYDNLDSYIRDLIEPKIKAGSVFIAETKIVDVERNMAGTVDLLEITSDGKINIYDYKTRSRKELHKIKLDEYSQQLKMYSDILEKTTGTSVEQRRIIPIRVVKDGKAIKIEIESQEPVALEKTGIEQLDELLDKLHSRLDYLQSISVTPSKRLAHKEKIETTSKAIKGIQLSKDVLGTINIATDEIEGLMSDLQDGTFDITSNLKEAHDILNLYKEFDKYIPDDLLDEELTDKIGQLIAHARLTERKLQKIEQDYLIQNGEKYGIIGTEGTKTTKDFLSPVKELGRWDRWVQGSSFSEHPILQTLRRAVEGVVLKVREGFITVRDQVKAKQKAMFDYLGDTSFDVMLQVDANGNKTGRLVDKVSNEYWIEVAKAKKDGNITWFQTNSVFNSERYAKDLDSYKKFLASNKKLENDVKNRLLTKWVAENNANWYKYHTAKESWYDPKWVEITSGKYKGTPVEDFYNYYRSTMKELMKDLPIETPYETFIPNLKADFLKRAANVGIGNALKAGFDFSFLEVLHEDPKYGKYDADNNPIDNIPLLYTEALNPNEKSYDLGLLLTVFAGTSLNHKNLSELEGLKEASLAFVRNQKEFLTTSTGEIKTTQSGQERQKSTTEISSHYGQLKDYVDVVFYGRRSSGEKISTFKNKYFDKVTAWAKGEEVVERDYSWNKMFDGVLNFTAIKALGFNFFAPITNYLSGEASSFMTGVNGLYFDTEHKTKALALLAANDEKAKLLIDKFKVKMGDFELDELKMLSTNMVKFGPTDLAFAGYHIGDYAVQNSNFIAMLLSGKHKIKWEDFDVVDGKLIERTLHSELETTMFRNKAMKVNKKIIGNMDQNDYASAKRYMLGRALMQFRNWLPAMFEDRWGRKRFDYDLEQWTEGRYRVGYKYILEHVVQPLLGKTKSRFLEWKTLTPEQKAAMRSNMLDLVMLVGVMVLLGAMRGDEDDDKTMMDRYSIRIMDRLLAELTFFSIPFTYDMFTDKYQILISPAAAVSTIEDISRVVKHTIGSLQADENADPARAISRLAPGINQIMKLEDVLTGVK